MTEFLIAPIDRFLRRAPRDRVRGILFVPRCGAGKRRGKRPRFMEAGDRVLLRAFGNPG